MGKPTPPTPAGYSVYNPLHLTESVVVVPRMEFDQEPSDVLAAPAPLAAARRYVLQENLTLVTSPEALWTVPALVSYLEHLIVDLQETPPAGFMVAFRQGRQIVALRAVINALGAIREREISRRTT